MSSSLTCRRPHPRVAGWCKDGAGVNGFLRQGGTHPGFLPRSTCHQVHLANEIQGAASGTITPFNLQACLGDRGVSLSSRRTGALGTGCGSQTVFPLRLCLVAKQTVCSVLRKFDIGGFKGQSMGWGLYFHFFLGCWGTVDSASV